MTTRDGFTRLVHTWLAEEGVLTTPDYLGDVLARTTATRQRPAWQSPGRWFPMLDVVVRPVAVPRLPLRTVGTVLALLALLVAALAIVGAQSRVPPPFGPARNGLITWALDGDIYVGDPVAGTARRAVASDDIDRNPVFAKDGTRLAFLRQVPTQTGKFDLVVADADGGSARTLTSVPVSMPEAVQWAPDGESIWVNDDAARLWRVPLDGAAAQLVLERVRLQPDAFRPPDGAELLYTRDDDPGALYAVDDDGSHPRELFGPRTAPCTCALAGPARWSHDGRHVAVPISLDAHQVRIYVIDAETGTMRQVAHQAGRWVENDPAWSPDGTRVAFNRWELLDTGDAVVRSIALVDVVSGDLTEVGIAPASEGAIIHWAPDGRSILSLPGTLVEAFTWSPGANGTVARPTMIELATGASRQLDWSVGSVASWQRLAP